MSDEQPVTVEALRQIHEAAVTLAWMPSDLHLRLARLHRDLKDRPGKFLQEVREILNDCKKVYDAHETSLTWPVVDLLKVANAEVEPPIEVAGGVKARCLLGIVHGVIHPYVLLGHEFALREEFKDHSDADLVKWVWDEVQTIPRPDPTELVMRLSGEYARTARLLKESTAETSEKPETSAGEVKVSARKVLEPPPPLPDGPCNPFSVRWGGKPYKVGRKRKRLLWDLLDFFWNRESAKFSEMTGDEKPWTVEVSDQARASAVNRFNSEIMVLVPNFPWTLHVSGAEIYKEWKNPPKSPGGE